MGSLNRFSLTLLALLLIPCESMWSQSNRHPLPNDFVADPLSFHLKKLGVGLQITHSTVASACEEYLDDILRPNDIDLQSLAVQEARLAQEAILLTRDPSAKTSGGHHSKAFLRAVKALKKSGYVILDYDSVPIGTCQVAIPKGFLGVSDEVDRLMDYGLTPVIEANIEDWQRKTLEIQDLQKQLDALNSQVGAEEQTFQELQAEEAALQSQIRNLQNELSGNLEMLVRILSGVVYDKNQDYLRPVVQSNLTPIPPNIPVDSKQVPDAYLNPELIDALEKFLSDYGPQLADLGLGKFTIVSAARTPINQSSLQGNRPVTAGILDTGHCLGVAFDFNVKGTDVDIKSFIDDQATPDQMAKLVSSGKPPSNAQASHLAAYKANPKAYQAKFEHNMRNWQALRALMAKSGLDMSPGISDANHVFLANYTGKSLPSRIFAAQTRLRMLTQYMFRMQIEQVAQAQKTDDLKNSIGAQMRAKFDLDSRIKEAQAKIGTLKGQLSSLTAQKQERDRQRELERQQQASGQNGNRPDHEHPYRGSDSNKPSEGQNGGNGGQQGGGQNGSDHAQAGPGGDGGMHDGWGDHPFSEHPTPN